MGESKPYLHRMHVDALLPKLEQPIHHSASGYGLKGTGVGVKILVIGSGMPDHSALPVPYPISAELRGVNFTQSPTERDFIGHATIVSGIIGAKTPELTGMAPDAKLFYAKAIDDHAVAKFDAVIASVLWGIIKEVDIIVLPLSSDLDVLALHECLAKANQAGVCIIAPMGADASTSYPARYREVFGIGSIGDGSMRYSAAGDIDICGEAITSCYLEETFVKASGTSCSAAIAAGLCACVIENHKRRKLTPDAVYETVKSLIKPKDS